MYSLHLLNALKLQMKQDNWSSWLDATSKIFWNHYTGLTCVHTSIKLYTSLFTKLRGRYQLFRANSKICYKAGNWHSSPPLRRETAAALSSFLEAATTSGWPDYRIQDIRGSFGCGSKPVFYSSISTRPWRAPLQGTSLFAENCEKLE